MLFSASSFRLLSRRQAHKPGVIVFLYFQSEPVGPAVFPSLERLYLFLTNKYIIMEKHVLQCVIDAPAQHTVMSDRSDEKLLAAP